MPGADDTVMDRLQLHLMQFPPVAQLLEKGSYIDEIMINASGPFQVKELDRQPVHFFCRCSPERFVNALSMLSFEDLKELKGNDQEIVCHYCGRKHIVTEQEILSIFETARAKLN
jgi:molecular chaperone Hsp33